MGNDLTTRVQHNTTPAEAGEGEQRPATMADQIRQMQNQFQMAMPKGAEAQQLVRDALTCLRTNPQLAECDPQSVLGGLMTVSQLGLRVGVLGHSWLLPFWDNRSKSRKAQLIIGYQGYRELAQRTGQIDTIIARPVHENDHFDLDYGVADNLVHKPELRGERGEAIGYYAIVKYTTGGYAFWYMSKTEVEQHRDRNAMARDKSGRIVGPWRDNFDAMAGKTVFLQLARWMPKSTELASAIEADNSVRLDTAMSPDAMVHGEKPTPDDIDGELVDEPGASGESAPAEDEQGYRDDDPDLATNQQGNA